jgi:2-phosphosulfolactate phosphatase
VADVHLQRDYQVRFDWGLSGARSVGRAADITVVVDVLSFTTTLSVAIEAGTSVLPYPLNRAGAAAFAAEHGAVLAVPRAEASPGQSSLSPASLRLSAPPARLVLPSPNGATIAFEVGNLCLAGCLRNADAVATWIAGRHDPDTTSVAVIAAGERWPDDSLRPAVEDLWGAGAIVAALRDEGWTDLSPEAETTAVVWDSVAADVSATLFNCASGRELVAAGYRDDVLIAGEVNASSSVPLLRNGSFESAD